MPGPDELHDDRPAGADAGPREPNGHAATRTVGPEEPAQAPPKGAIDQARAALDAQIAPILMVTFQGVVATCPNIPGNEVLNSIARCAGKVIGSSVKGDLQTLFQLRKGFQDSFHEGVKSAPLVPFTPPGRPQA